MTNLTDFSDDDEQIDRTDRPKVRRLHGVKDPNDASTLYGMIGRDAKRDGRYVYSSPRHRDRNYFRKIGGYPISTDVLERLAEPPKSANIEPVEIVYIIQREGTDDHPPLTVFEYDLEDYMGGAVIDFDPFGEQRCPTLDDARAVWEGYGNAMFATGRL